MVKKRKRKHNPSERSSRPKITKTQLVSYFLIFLMVLSVGAVILYNPQPQTADGPVRQTQNGWVLKENDQIFFYNHPSAVSHYSYPDSLMTQLVGQPQVILTFDPAGMDEQALSVTDYARLSLQQDLVQHETAVTAGIRTNHSAYTLPEMSCDDSTQYVPVILMRMGNVTEVTTEDNCYRLTGNSPQTLLSLVEGIRYKLYEVNDGQTG